MERRNHKRKFWAILAMVNVVAMIYPVNLCLQADTGDAQFFATIVLLGAALLLAITDTVSAILAYMQ
jgi:hypothetical protein